MEEEGGGVKSGKPVHISKKTCYLMNLDTNVTQSEYRIGSTKVSKNQINNVKDF